MTWKKVDEFEKGDIQEMNENGQQIEGELLRKQVEVGKHNSNLYTIRRKDGVVKKIWGTAILDNRLQEVPVGARVRITFEGEIKSKSGNPLKSFTVEVWENGTA